MRTWGTLIGLGLATTAVAAAPFTSRPSGQAGRLHVQVLRKLEVLDLDPAKGYAAFKVVHERMGDMGEDTVDCGYPGMKEHPRAGVTLALWDFGAQKVVGEWVVYAAAVTREDCSATATNEANLAAAKARFLEVGLDIAKKPAGVPPKDGAWALSVGGSPVTVKLVESEARDAARAMTLNRATLTLGGVPFYERTWTHDDDVMWWSRHEYGAAYVVGDRVVFVEDDLMTTMRSSDHFLGLSQPLALGM